VETAPVAISLGMVLALVWLAGFVTLAVSWLVRGRNLRRKIFSERAPLSAELERRVDSAARRVGLAEAPRCFTVGRDRTPGVLGFFTPVVILPRGLEATLTAAEFEAVLITCGGAIRCGVRRRRCV
jgi:beta-lactamase regulating signal transducer with metallopeptidase domain